MFKKGLVYGLNVSSSFNVIMELSVIKRLKPARGQSENRLTLHGDNGYYGMCTCDRTE